MKGFFWCLNVLFIIDFEIFLLAYGLLDFFSINNTLRLKINCLILVFWLPTFSIFTVYFSQSLEYFFRKKLTYFLFRCFILEINDETSLNLFYSEAGDIENSLQMQSQHFPNSLEIGAKDHKKPSIKIEKTTTFPKSAPQFLVKFSASYFQIADFKKQGLLGFLNQSKKNKKNSGKHKKHDSKTKNPAIFNKDSKDFEEISQNNSKKLPNSKDLSSKELDEKKSQISSISSVSDKTLKNCLICYDKSPNAVLMECGHGGKI